MITPIQQLAERDWMNLCDEAMTLVVGFQEKRPRMNRQILAQAVFHSMVHGLSLKRDDIEALINEMHGHYRIGQSPIIVTNSDDA